jgi:hypothetical protein
MRSLCLCVFILSIFVDFGAPTSEAQIIQTLADFQSSSFCREYHCRQDSRWTLKIGGTNISYSLNGCKSNCKASVDVVLNDQGSVTALDFDFFPDAPDAPIDQSQIRAFELFLKSANPHDSTVAISYLHSRLRAWLCPLSGDRSCAPINATAYTHDGPFKLRIGRSYATFGVYLSR